MCSCVAWNNVSGGANKNRKIKLVCFDARVRAYAVAFDVTHLVVQHVDFLYAVAYSPQPFTSHSPWSIIFCEFVGCDFANITHVQFCMFRRSCRHEQSEKPHFMKLGVWGKSKELGGDGANSLGSIRLCIISVNFLARVLDDCVCVCALHAGWHCGIYVWVNGVNANGIRTISLISF